MSKLISLANFTTLGIGGRANVVVAQRIEDLVKYSPSLILGNGSNVLISDRGVRETVVINKARFFSLQGNELYVESGLSLSYLALHCAQNGLSGLEWAYLLPATVGGALIMNAGAYGKQISDVVRAVGVFRDGKIVELNNAECGFEYRKSGFLPGDVILYAYLSLSFCDTVFSLEMIEQTRTKRALQPKGKSAGCIYKTEGKSAGWYIEQSGLKNKRVGDIYVSPIHAGFFINAGRGTACDMLKLMDYVEKTVQDKFGKTLKKEIKLIGEF